MQTRKVTPARIIFMSLLGLALAIPAVAEAGRGHHRHGHSHHHYDRHDYGHSHHRHHRERDLYYNGYNQVYYPPRGYYNRPYYNNYPSPAPVYVDPSNVIFSIDAGDVGYILGY